jgi:Domain of unknown function (DUF4190)
MSSSTNPPDPYGTGDQSSGSTPSGGSDAPDSSYPPPPSGSSPSYGSTPPAYGSTPPSYGSSSYDSPPAYGSTPPPYTGGTPSYGSDYGTTPGYGYAYPKNNLGVWSLVLGLVGIFVCGLIAGIPAIIVGNKSRRAIAEGQANNGGLATAGIVLGWISVALSVLGLVIFILLAATGALAELSTGTQPSGF